MKLKPKSWIARHIVNVQKDLVHHMVYLVAGEAVIVK